MSSVIRGDGAVPASSALTRYYAESGTPAGYWLGAGLAGLDEGRGVEAGSVVSEQGLWHLLGMQADPVTGKELGNFRRPPAPLARRISTWIDALPADLPDEERASRVAVIEAEEATRERSLTRPVSAFDLTFSVPKSVSTVWALADEQTQAVIHQVHREAIRMALAWAQEQVVFTRTGRNGVYQEPVRGVVAAAFDHWDSRAGDPHLHTHVVVANRVQTLDGRWRTLDSKTLHRYTVALSELHEGVLEDLLSKRLGVEWTARPRRDSPVPRHDITGVPVELMEQFSQRSAQIAAAKDDLVACFAAEHGRQPSNPEVLRLRQQATLATRPDKCGHLLGELCADWRARAAATVGRDPAGWVRTLSRGNADHNGLQADRVHPGAVQDLGARTLAAVSLKKATFAHANLLAEAHRQLHGIGFATPADRIAIADRAVSHALGEALLLNPADPTTPEVRLHRGAEIYSTSAIFDAETRLLDHGRDLTAPAVPPCEVEAAAAAGPVELGADQRAAILEVAISGRRLDLLIGPAGTGKTTSLRALATAWTDYYGAGSVIGLAPSAVAADVLGSELGIAAENTSKWLLEHDRASDRTPQIEQLQADLDSCSSPGTARARRLTPLLDAEQKARDRWSLTPGQLLILDEASLASTNHLDRITSHAREMGAKVLLVGDPAQLGAVDAGGAFVMLTQDRTDIAELTDPRRFTEQWERDASLQLREGDPAAIEAYQRHGRIHNGTRDDALAQVLERWADDTAAGLDTVMIAGDHVTVTDLNLRARTHLITSGVVDADGVPLAEGAAGVGDWITTRRNDRTLHRPGGWVRNGDTWTITATHDNGSLTAVTATGSTVELPADYVRQHVELGYATTAHQVQGRTLDTAHSVIDESTTREALYVAATRGRHTNTLTVTLDNDHEHETGDVKTMARDVLNTVLRTSGTDTSAHTVAARQLTPEPPRSATAVRRIDPGNDRVISL